METGLEGMLKDKVVAVTGGAGGIGQGIARALLDCGAKAGIIDLDRERSRSAAKELGRDSDKLLAVAADVTDPDSITSALLALKDRFGQLDGLVNGAGVVRLGAAEELTSADIDFEFGVNAKGILLASQAAAEIMKVSGGGAIVNIASNAGKVGYSNMAGYNASKAAVISLTRSLSVEWASHNINVNAVCPGGVATEMLESVADFLSEKLSTDRDELLASMVPAQLGRHIRPVEVGRVVAFLLSDSAQIIRGQSISIDGGDVPW